MMYHQILYTVRRPREVLRHHRAGIARRRGQGQGWRVLRIHRPPPVRQAAPRLQGRRAQEAGVNETPHRQGLRAQAGDQRASRPECRRLRRATSCSSRSSSTGS